MVVGHGSNAANYGVTPADEAAAARSSWRAIRTQAPDAPIVVIGTWYKHPSFVAQQEAMQAALKAEFLAWRDPNAAFIDPHDGSIVAQLHAATIDDVEVVAGDSGARVLIVAGKPLGEPVARHGPFVMNTRDEVVQAFEDYQAGRLGVIPAAHANPHNTPTSVVESGNE